MFDYLRSSYNLGEQFTNVVCQTKEIEYDIGGTMTHYWISPDRVLWYPDYNGTNTFEEILKDDPRYEPEKRFLNFEWVPTGQRGKYKVHPITKYIEIYPAEWKGEWSSWPRCRIHLKQGVLQDYEDVTGR
jgi:hypothetical protein